MKYDEYKKLILELTDDLVSVEYEDGLYYDDTDKANETDTHYNENITDLLSEYFNVNVTSVHADGCEYLGVWICYKEDSKS